MISFKAILFDMDGTLVNAFLPIIYALNKTLQEIGMETMSDAAIIRHTGRGECSMSTLFGDKREAAMQRFLQFHDERLFEVKPMDGAEEILNDLNAKRIPIAIVTSKSQPRAEKQLAHLGWTQKIQVVIGLTPERRQKPDPHTIDIACQTLGIHPEDTVMIGDGTADMKAAVRAGAMAVGISHAFSDYELKDVGATHCFQNLCETHAWLNA